MPLRTKRRKGEKGRSNNTHICNNQEVGKETKQEQREPCCHLRETQALTRCVSEIDWTKKTDKSQNQGQSEGTIAKKATPFNQYR